MSFSDLRRKTFCTAIATAQVLALVGCNTRKPVSPDAPTPCPGLVLDSAWTPIKGGGGAFTLYSQNKWLKQTDQTTYCTEFETADLPASPMVASSGFHPALPTTFEGPWQVYGHDPRGMASRNGVAVAVDSSHGCSGDTKKASVTIRLINPSKTVSFYPNSLPHPNPLQDDKRFMDVTGACRQDEDLCERVALIRIQRQEYTCIDGDCSFTIGPPNSHRTGRSR